MEVRELVTREQISSKVQIENGTCPENADNTKQ